MTAAWDLLLARAVVAYNEKSTRIDHAASGPGMLKKYRKGPAYDALQKAAGAYSDAASRYNRLAKSRGR